MRFSNWDVLLFPEDSRIPIQEFEVKCQALPQSFDNPISNRLLALAGNNHQNSVTHVPTLTCFINSLDQDRPFRVSIHSWEKPKPSDLLQNFQPAPETITFEAKLYIDGKFKALRNLGAQNTWPEVIDSVTGDDFAKPLRFPLFHAEILQQSHWDAGDSLGRIRIVIAEGISHSSGFADGRSFDKLREVVAFSFQHAPKHILEYSGIAWPNARMFSLAAQNVRANNFDAHAHSPRRPGSTSAPKDKQQTKATTTCSPGAIPLHASKWAPATAKQSLVDDPFVEPLLKPKSQLQRRSIMDVSMKDASASSKNLSEMSGVEIEQPGLEQFVNRAKVEEILGVLTPAKRSSLLHALLPLKQDAAKDSTGGALKLLMADEPHETNVPSTATQSQSVFDRGGRQCSNDSRRSTSGQSGTMSWEETPALGELWSGANNEYPGLLPTLQSANRRHRSDSVPSKRKRSMSPAAHPHSGSEITLNTKGMSTSPCKATSTPARIDQEDDSTITVQTGSKSRAMPKR